MSQPFFVDHTGRPLEDYKHTTQLTESDEQQKEDPLWVVASREAEKQSTKKHQ
jgi:hypothetical protein